MTKAAGPTPAPQPSAKPCLPFNPSELAAVEESALSFLGTSPHHTFILDTLKRQVVWKHEGITELEDEVKHFLEQNGHASFIRNCAFATRMRLPFSAYAAEKPYKGQHGSCQVCVPKLWLQLLAVRLGRLHHRLGMPCIASSAAALAGHSMGQSAPAYADDSSESAHCIYTAQDVLAAICQPHLLHQMLKNLAPYGWEATSASRPSCCKNCTPVVSKSGGASADPPNVQLLDSQTTVLASTCAVPRGTLKLMFRELHLDQCQTGVDDIVNPSWAEQRVEESWDAIQAESISSCRLFLRCGAVVDARKRLWEIALGMKPLNLVEQRKFEGLQEQCSLGLPVVDALVDKDLENVANSSQFFLFEDLLRTVMQVFARDSVVHEGTSMPSLPWMSLGCDYHSAPPSLKLTPPSGILPGQGFVLFPAPLCYLYSEPAEVYRMFRSMYCRFWCRLHNPVYLQDDPMGTLSCLPQLLHTFHALLEVLDPDVLGHLVCIGVQPLSVAASWLMSAFVGYLEMEQLLLLWDRVIGYDSLLPLAMLAAAIVSFRHDAIMGAESPTQLQSVMADLSQLKVIPLLQAIYTTTIAAP